MNLKRSSSKKRHIPRIDSLYRVLLKNGLYFIAIDTYLMFLSEYIVVMTVPKMCGVFRFC